jgi:hypothetical protein
MYMKKIAIFGALILLFVLTGAIGCQSRSQNQQPVEVVSLLGPIPPYNPGGPNVKLTLKNTGNEPVTSLKATLKLARDFEFDFADVTPSSLLLPGGSVNVTVNLIGPQGSYTNDTSYPLTITLTLKNGNTLTYTKQVQIGSTPPV